jgi:hypothetical protein
LFGICWLSRDSLARSDQAIRLIVDDLIAFTDGRFQAISIDDSNMGSGIVDQTGVLQAAGSDSHALSSSAQHVGNELLRHQDFGSIYSVVAQEQPTAETLLQRMQAIADSRL